MTDSYTAQDVIILEDYKGEWQVTDFADGSVVELEAPNELSSITTGFNGNGLGAHNEPGRQRNCTLRIVRGGADDKRINESYNFWKNRDLRFKPLKAKFVKNVAHEDGSITKDTTECKFGLPSGQPVFTVDTTGNIEQVVAIYTIQFADSKRSM